MQISFGRATPPDSGIVIVCCGAESRLSRTARDLDRQSGETLSRALEDSAFTGASGTFLDLPAPGGLGMSRLVLAGTGKGLRTERQRQDFGGKIYAHLAATKTKSATLILEATGSDVSGMAAEVGYGTLLRSYRFDKYHTKQAEKQKALPESLTIGIPSAAASRRQYKKLAATAEGVFLTRDLVSEPPNVLYPDSFAKRLEALSKDGVEVEILDEAALKRLGMHALLGVGQGSVCDSRLVVMQWRGAAKSAPTAAFIGKGVTFDTGGISLKPGANMHDMKWDMGGAGAVAGLMKALAGRKARANVVGIVGLVENMPDGGAQRPGDIVRSMSGQTIEILNTDAEGRLVLADALWYAQDRFKPALMVNLATLTGAIIISLGHEHAGMFSNDDRLARELSAAGEKTGEKVWRMPLGAAYDRMIKSDVADMQNIGGRGAGSITAAQFLQRFVNDTPWAHLDIAGTAWSGKAAPTVPKGGTGFGVRLLNRFVRDNCETSRRR